MKSMILITILFPMLAAMIGYLIFQKNEDRYYDVALLTTLITFVLMIILCINPDTSMNISGICALGINLKTDGFRKVYGLIITFMWLMTMMLSKDYFKHHHNLNRYFFFNLMTLGATLGVFMAADLFSAFVFFEIMSFTSFPWVIQEEDDGAIRAANTYLAVAVIGGLTALMGIFIIYNKLGTLTLEELYPLASAYENKTILYVAASCILFGFGAKAGMFPLHIWLPKAHPVAPAPASALLSGVLTKSGIWGVVAISINIFRYDFVWGNVILILGTVTMFLGALLALFSIDLKRTLACSSMSQIGFILVGLAMTIFLGEENALAARGTILHMVNHSLFKLVLFMSAGVVYMNTHALNLNEIKGFGKNKPLLKICFLVAALGIAGIPGLNGYVSKTLIHEGIVEANAEHGYLKIFEWIFLISGGLTLAYMTKLYICIFKTDNEKYKEKKKYMGPLSYIALTLSMVILPILGLNANRIMIKISNLTMNFFNGEELNKVIEFYSLENLKGGLISIIIGVLTYIFIVRKFMIRNGEYVNLWPEKLDLEDLVYRPLLLKVLPDIFGCISKIISDSIDTIVDSHIILNTFGYLSEVISDSVDSIIDSHIVIKVLGFISHLFSDSLDYIIYLLRKSVLKETRYFETDFVLTSAPYRFGSMIDKAKKRDDNHYARKSYRIVSSIEYYTHQLSDSLSVALLFMVLMIVVMLMYVLLR